MPLINDCVEAVRWRYDNDRPDAGEFTRQDVWFGTRDRLLRDELTAGRFAAGQ